MNQPSRLILLRVCLAVTAFLTAMALFDFAKRTYQAELLFVYWRHTAFAAAMGLVIVIGIGALIATWTPLQFMLLNWLDTALLKLKSLGRLNILFLAMLLAVFAYYGVASPISYLNSFYFRLLIYWVVALFSSILLWGYGQRRSFSELFAASLLLVAVVYKVAVYLPEISSFPLTLGWSEASRYFYASLYFSQRIYDLAVPPSVLHPSRYLMQALPFLISDSPIWLHRLWQIVLWFVVTFTTSYLLTRRLSISDPLKRWMFLSWSFLFLLIGPVYYHLQVTVIIVLLGYNRRSSWKTFAAILIASIWAGISRVNWFPVPGMLAATIYFLEEPTANRAIWRYLFKPVLWVAVGTLTAFASQSIYALVSGNPLEQFTSSFSSDLLWYRLLPNPTYPMGVLLALVLVSAPLLWVVFASLKGHWRSYHPIRLMGVSSILLVLAAGGVVVSTKIGGGSNLHNLDAYMTLLLVVSAWIYFARTAPDDPSSDPTPAGQLVIQLHWGVSLFILLVPVYFTIFIGPVTPPPDQSRLSRAMDAIYSAARSAQDKGREVLLMSERQLLTFNTLENVPLVPDYEKVFLMEMAMSENPSYLGQFYQDLKDQRFGLIVSEPLSTRYKGRAKSFGEENDAWVKNVAEPVLCYYEPFRSFRELKIQLLKPRSTPGTCPQFSEG